MNTTAHAHDTTASTASSRDRRADAGSIRLSQRDIDGLLLVGEHWGAPADLLAAAIKVDPDRLPALTARWRRAGYAATGRLVQAPPPGRARAARAVAAASVSAAGQARDCPAQVHQIWWPLVQAVTAAVTETRANRAVAAV